MTDHVYRFLSLVLNESNILLKDLSTIDLLEGLIRIPNLVIVNNDYFQFTPEERRGNVD
jgi:hypothetical protein